MSATDATGAELLSWDVPLVGDRSVHLEAKPAEVITIVGANGAGKSALATRLAGEVESNRLRRVLAQRKIWMTHSGPDISASGRESQSQNLEYWDRAEDSRIRDHADAARASIALFDLLGLIGEENRRDSDLLRRGVSIAADEIEALNTRVSDVLNSVLERAGLFVSIQMTEHQSFKAVHRSFGTEYPIVQMSDGERSALLLSAEVLTAPYESIIMLDEPERHMHRSISAKLVEALVEARSDCAFLLFTHDLDLAAEMVVRPGRVYASLGVEWEGDKPARWDLQEVTATDAIPEAARRAVLGGRKQILFVEGSKSSLDAPLYGTLFPDWTVVPSEGCESVIRNVKGLAESADHHWVEPSGIVDGDGRTGDERRALTAKGIHVLPVSEVESLYYCSGVLAAVAKRQASVDDSDPAELEAAAKTEGLKALGGRGVLESLASKLAKNEVTRLVLEQIPSSIDERPIGIRVESPYPTVLGLLRGLHATANYEALVTALPVRDSPFRAKVANALRFRTPEDYQSAALAAISNDEELRASLLERVLSTQGSSD